MAAWSSRGGALNVGTSGRRTGGGWPRNRKLRRSRCGVWGAESVDVAGGEKDLLSESSERLPLTYALMSRLMRAKPCSHCAWNTICDGSISALFWRSGTWSATCATSWTTRGSRSRCPRRVGRLSYHPQKGPQAHQPRRRPRPGGPESR